MKALDIIVRLWALGFVCLFLWVLAVETTLWWRRVKARLRWREPKVLRSRSSAWPTSARLSGTGEDSVPSRQQSRDGEAVRRGW